MLTFINIDIILGVLCILIESNKTYRFSFMQFLNKYTLLNKYNLTRIWAGLHIVCVLIMIMCVSIHGAIGILICILLCIVMFWIFSY